MPHPETFSVDVQGDQLPALLELSNAWGLSLNRTIERVVFLTLADVAGDGVPAIASIAPKVYDSPGPLA
jgi:hypothetical protein